MVLELRTFNKDKEFPTCYELHITAKAEDYQFNKSVAKADWFDKDGNPTLDIFQFEEEVRPHFNPEIEDWRDTIYDMIMKVLTVPLDPESKDLQLSCIPNKERLNERMVN